METSARHVPEFGLNQFFSASEARVDRWRSLNRIVRTLATQSQQDASGLRDEALAVLDELRPLEDLNGYPGPFLMAQVDARLAASEWHTLSRLVQRISAALMSNSYRDDQEAWKAEEEGELRLPDFLPPSIGHGQSRKPYFEVLVVAAGERSTWPDIREGFHRLRRDDDCFVYEMVVVGSFEDAVLASIFNYNLQSVVIVDGFSFASQYTSAALRDIVVRNTPAGTGVATQDMGSALARLVRGLRPELDVFLSTDRDIGQLAGSDAAAPLRRIFYGAEEPMEIHLAILDGIKDRYDAPYFDNLKHYAARPIGTFHALPVARGKSIFKSNWIRDMGEFYGANLFLAESSATTGGLDSLLEPTGNIKASQDKAARALGGDRSFFVTNGTSTANKIVHQALLTPGDIVLIDRDCHKSHHYGIVLAGAQPLYIDAYPLTQYSMYGSLAIRPIKQALLALKAEGKLDRARMLVLTNCTFDGHVANVEQTMLECLAIKPDLIFLWDEAWFGYARFSPLLRMRTAMGGAAKLREMMHDPAYRDRYESFRQSIAGIGATDDRLLDMQLLPDPEQVCVRVYETDSIHKSMSALRQASIIVVADQAFHTVEAQFKEAFFTHTSTSPNLQIIASIDVARRQMELEGYELVQRAIQLAIEIRREINHHPLISRFFRAATPAEMIPEAFRKSGFADYGMAGKTIADATQALRDDEFFLDPTRITLLCGNAGYDGTRFKGLLAETYDIQINKTSRNSVLVQININNTRSDMAHLIKALADISRGLERELEQGGETARSSFEARVKTLVEDVPELPNFSHFHKALRENSESATPEGDMRAAYYLAYRPQACECLRLNDERIDDRLKHGPELVSARFVIPYPPGFPIMVPGQVITPETIAFMRKLDVKEIHGYNAVRGLELLKPEALDALRRKTSDGIAGG
ncbi:decarboxylase [Paraburkholderia sp. FT54]|uniref:decarboxylase n=1 Tax=Paraburkholderia sp. FT54 TaxID=3074437 RepID=UPI002877F87A|nr:decarboxylase [Paraburkholderia sp. FT54]WNC94159.1 decarboxylase [Paraburkholderia sp. FT54]